MEEIKLTRRDFISNVFVSGAAIMLFGTEQLLAAMAPRPHWAERKVSEVKLNADGKLKILNLTDLHFFGEGMLIDTDTLKDIKQMVKKFEPDMIMITGDFWNENYNGEGMKRLEWSCHKIEKYKLPWAFAWGNHDKLDDYNLGHKYLENSKYSLYRGAMDDGNYRIRVIDGRSDETVWNLIVLNDSRGGLKREQLVWFKDEAGRIRKESGKVPPAFIFMHIPLVEYMEIARSGNAKGVMFESVCHDNSDRDSIPVFKESGMVKAIFCGHDHYNDYSGYIEGIQLVYGRSTGSAGYGADRVPKGGTLITIDGNDKSYEFVSVLPEGATWSNDGFEYDKKYW